jgi:hypothetical protein
MTTRAVGTGCKSQEGWNQNREQKNCAADGTPQLGQSFQLILESAQLYARFCDQETAAQALGIALFIETNASLA